MVFVALFFGGAAGCGLLNKAAVSPIIVNVCATIAVSALLTALGVEIYEVVKKRSSSSDDEVDRDDGSARSQFPGPVERPALTDGSKDLSKLQPPTSANDEMDGSTIKDIARKR